MTRKKALREPGAKRFLLVRKDDETGISGTGIVAEGVEFADGRCVMCWLTPTSSVCVYNSLEELADIHGHGGRTVVRVVDKQGPTIRQTTKRPDRRPAGTRSVLKDLFDRLRK